MTKEPRLEEFIVRRLTLYELLTKELAKVQEKIKMTEDLIFKNDTNINHSMELEPESESP